MNGYDRSVPYANCFLESFGVSPPQLVILYMHKGKLMTVIIGCNWCLRRAEAFCAGIIT